MFPKSSEVKELAHRNPKLVRPWPKLEFEDEVSDKRRLEEILGFSAAMLEEHKTLPQLHCLTSAVQRSRSKTQLDDD